MNNLSGPAVEILKVAYVTEFGLDAEVTNCINMLYTLYPVTGPSDDAGVLGQPDVDGGAAAFSIFGISDQLFTTQTGNHTYIEKMAAYLDPSQITLGAMLTAITQTGGRARYVLTFTSGSSTFTVTADHVVLAIPFTTLRTCRHERRSAFSAVKRKCINELGYGQNAKLMCGFSSKPWRAQGSEGLTFTDLPYQSSWETSRLQPGNSGIITAYSGAPAPWRPATAPRRSSTTPSSRSGSRPSPYDPEDHGRREQRQRASRVLAGEPDDERVVRRVPRRPVHDDLRGRARALQQRPLLRRALQLGVRVRDPHRRLPGLHGRRRRDRARPSRSRSRSTSGRRAESAPIQSATEKPLRAVVELSRGAVGLTMKHALTALLLVGFAGCAPGGVSPPLPSNPVPLGAPPRARAGPDAGPPRAAPAPRPLRARSPEHHARRPHAHRRLLVAPGQGHPRSSRTLKRKTPMRMR